MDFHLFRIRVFRPKQLNLLSGEKTPQEILRNAINENPSLEYRGKSFWHIGNVFKISGEDIYFRFGKSQKSTVEVYSDGNFKDAEFETAPYTHVLVDVNLELCLIAKKSKLSPYINSVSRQLARVLNETQTASQQVVEFEIDEIRDPEDFINQIKNASLITKFWLTVKRPNPIDVENDFVKPVQKTVREIGAVKSKVEFQGETLSPTNVEKLARSAASTGDDAGATIKPRPKSKKINKNLKGNPIVISHEGDLAPSNYPTMLNEARRRYRSVRDNG